MIRSDDRRLHLLPTSYYLDTGGQISLLSKIATGQLLSLSLQIFPHILLDNLAGGFGQHDPYEELMKEVARLKVPHIRLITSVIGLVPSICRLTDVVTLEIDDEGFWDGGQSESYAALASHRHQTLRDLLAALSLTSLTYRRKQITHRPRDYAFFDFANVVRSAGLTSLESLNIRHHNVSNDILREIFSSSSTLRTFSYYPPIPHPISKPPAHLLALRTNCSLTPEYDAMPIELQELNIRRDGPLLPPPPDTYVPRLPSTLTILNAHIAPGVYPSSISELFHTLENLRSLEMLVVPLPWLDECTCVAVKGEVLLQTAFSHHSNVTPDQLGWNAEITISVLLGLLKGYKLEVLVINHDHHLSRNPFPDIQHLGVTAARDNARTWWKENKDFYGTQADLFFAALPINEFKWRVCSWKNEAWISWHRGETGRLLVETAESE